MHSGPVVRAMPGVTDTNDLMTFLAEAALDGCPHGPRCLAVADDENLHAASLMASATCHP